MSDNTPVPDIQDPLPEANWLWRRVFTFVSMLTILAIMIGLAVATNRIVGNVVGRIDTMSAMAVAQIARQALGVIEEMFRLMFWALITVVTYYMVAPSAEQITKVIQTAGLLKGGVQLATRSIETADRREIASTAAIPPQPVVPPVATAPGTKAASSAPAPEASEGAIVLPPASTGLRTDEIVGDKA